MEARGKIETPAELHDSRMQGYQLDGDELLKDMKQLVDAGWRYKGRGGNLAATKSLEHWVDDIFPDRPFDWRTPLRDEMTAYME